MTGAPPPIAVGCIRREPLRFTIAPNISKRVFVESTSSVGFSKSLETVVLRPPRKSNRASTSIGLPIRCFQILPTIAMCTGPLDHGYRDERQLIDAGKNDLLDSLVERLLQRYLW